MGQIGKVPPQDIKVEQAVLGALLLEREALAEVAEILQPEDFYVEKNIIIYKTILELFAKSEPVDILTVSKALRKSGKSDLCGGALYVNELTTKVNSAANISTHAIIIAEASIKRKIIAYASVLIEQGYDSGIDGLLLLDQANHQLNAITNNLAGSSIKTMQENVGEVMVGIEKAMSIPDGIIGIPSGFEDVDKVTGGWRRGDLIILAARPAMGKTSFAVNCMRNAAITYGKPVAFFSLEMSVPQLTTRMITSEVDGINLTTSRLGRGRITNDELKYIHTKIGPLIKSKLHLDDHVGLTITTLRSKAIKLKRKHDIQMIIIDYLQLMSGGTGTHKGGNREQEISAITRGLKLLAKELDIPVIALSQLNRSVESRGGEKKPQLQDLRESGAIEQDADVVMFLYRPEYYNIFEDENGGDLRGLGELIIAKHRNGALDNVYMKFIAGQTKFKNMEGDEFLPVTSVHSIHSFPEHSTPSLLQEDEDQPF